MANPALDGPTDVTFNDTPILLNLPLYEASIPDDVGQLMGETSSETNTFGDLAFTAGIAIGYITYDAKSGTFIYQLVNKATLYHTLWRPRLEFLLALVVLLAVF